MHGFAMHLDLLIIHLDIRNAFYFVSHKNVIAFSKVATVNRDKIEIYAIYKYFFFLLLYLTTFSDSEFDNIDYYSCI